MTRQLSVHDLGIILFTLGWLLAGAALGFTMWRTADALKAPRPKHRARRSVSLEQRLVDNRLAALMACLHEVPA